ncbi:3-phosphoshikimate 1-carboxyvinyltransferase [Marinilabiliaceae bacterium JC017]|nr:3-phosphoshikimate 1-carboxyvinyltransferase [Marinilabiliaceae bacterium JC017]
MKFQVIAPEKLNNSTITLPTSKSISNRLLMLNALSYSPYEIRNLSDSDDTRVMLNVLNANSNVFDVGAAGTSMRFLTAFLSKIVGEWTLTGSDRMKERPIGILVDALTKLGAKIDYLEKEGYPPLKIWGSALKGDTLELPGNISSQYITALLLIAPTIEDGLTIKLTGDIISKPYIALTLALMAEFGVKGFWKNDTIVIPEANYQPKQMTVEADWSAASYWYEIIALNPGMEVTLKGLKRNSLQGDSQVSEIFKPLGVKTKFSQRGVILTNIGNPNKSFKYNFVNQPDLAQTVVVTCCLMNIPFEFTGLQSLKIKETDRIAALIKELSKMGYTLTTNNVDTLAWKGEKTDVTPNTEITIDTYKDHRMAMAFAPAACRYANLLINEPGVVSKSYPNYWDDLALAGIKTEKRSLGQ